MRRDASIHRKNCNLYCGTQRLALRLHGASVLDMPSVTTRLTSSLITVRWRKRNGLGGDLITRDKFGSLKCHMEFRYAVEPGKTGQSRGNSGLFFHGIGELQILNNYGTGGFWNECGAIYKKAPAKVNAAAPPLQWQTYDVEIILPEEVDDKSMALVTAYLNGQPIPH